jgi:hypothetical protein
MFFERLCSISASFDYAHISVKTEFSWKNHHQVISCPFKLFGVNSRQQGTVYDCQLEMCT